MTLVQQSFMVLQWILLRQTLATYYKLCKLNITSCIVVQAEQFRSLPIVHVVILSTNTNGEASEY
jgi:hypothetical protein